MSTNDVPGANPANGDQLRPGCWAEAPDGRMLLNVEAVNEDRVIFSYFLLNTKPVTSGRFASPRDVFMRKFSFREEEKKSMWGRGKKKGDDSTIDDKGNIKWTWHDKTAFPWNRIIEAGLPEGMQYALTEDQITDAMKQLDALRQLGLIQVVDAAKPVDAKDIESMVDQVVSHPAAKEIVSRLQSAIDKLKPAGD